MKRWQDWANIVLGAWMFASPWVMGFAHDGSDAALSAWLLGTAIGACAAMAYLFPQLWEEGINCVLGLFLFASPWVLGFENQTDPRTNAAIVGLLVVALAIWAMLEDDRVRERLHMRSHAKHP
jgi:SPW repeat